MSLQAPMSRDPAIDLGVASAGLGLSMTQAGHAAPRQRIRTLTPVPH
jgi:hypothetical protein